MVAGATGIDLFLLVIDAAEGARPQTHEHLAILRLLGIERGVVAVTKADAVDAETLELALAEARELVPGAEVVAVSAKTGAGLDELRAALARRRRRRERAARDGADAALRRPRLHAARASAPSSPARSGRARSATGDELRVEPAGLRRARAQRPGARPRRSSGPRPGQRVAVSLPGSRARRSCARGDALVEPGAYPVSYRLDVALEELEPIAGARVHRPPSARATSPRASCASATATRSCGSREPVVAARGDRVVLRTRDDGRRRHACSTRRRRARSTRSGSSCSSAATRSRSCARSSTSPSPAPSCRRAALLAAGRARAGPRRGRAAPATGSSRPSGSRSCAPTSASASPSAPSRSPLDPGIPLAELLPPSRGRRRVAAAARTSSAAARRPTCPGAAAALGERAAAAAALEAAARGADDVVQGRGPRAGALPRGRRDA